MRTFFLAIGLAVIGCLLVETASISPAYAQITHQIKREKDIDGRINDWYRDPDRPEPRAYGLDRKGDVPISSIDIVFADWRDLYGYYRDLKGLTGPSFPADKPFYVLIHFSGEVFTDSIETSVDIWFDTNTDQYFSPTDPAEGQKQEWIDFERGVVPWGYGRDEWEEFYPDRHFKLVGKEGKITGEQYQYWDGSKWVGEEVRDAPEIEAAFLGKNLEIALSWESIGDPRPGLEEVVFLKLAVGTFQGDYYDLTEVYRWSINGFFPQVIEAATFGRIKAVHK